MLKVTDRPITRRLRSLSGWAALALVVVGTCIGFATFLILTGLTPLSPTSDTIRQMLMANVVIIVVMVVMILAQVINLFIERRQRTAGAGLHIRLVGLFSLVSVVPALLVAAFAIVTLNRGLDAWFSDETRSIVDTASSVADAYLNNAAQVTRNDMANMSNELVQEEQLDAFTKDRPAFLQRLARSGMVRGLSAIYMFNIVDDQNVHVVANIAANDKIPFVRPSADEIAAADKGEFVLLPPSPSGNIIRALSKLQAYPNQYLYIYRIVPAEVVQELQKTRTAKAQFDAMQSNRQRVQLTFGLVYVLVALIFLLAAVWIGMWFSDRLVVPIVRLLNASRDVAAGDFNAKVKIIEGPGDLQRLSTTFNLMTDQIALSRDELVRTNEQLDERRRFTEAMLEGVTAGVIGINPQGIISLVNRAALQHLGATDANLMGKSLDQALPDFAALYRNALARPDGSADGQVDMTVEGQELSLIVRITTELGATSEHGHVLTFDDITQLVSAQRNSAWSDIARRIAHEIKNPLTPIQLSAERLKRKYLKEIKSDKQVFEQCTDTIIRQVGDLGRIVDEFSSFARMPSAILERSNLNEMVREATVLQRVTAADIDIRMSLAHPAPNFPFDRRLLTQAVTNLVKNAREAIEARTEQVPRGEIVIETGFKGEAPYVSVTDNGIGLPQENRSRLAEPYMTTREKGTGLGLAIVKRIMEEHGGSLRLADSASGPGASVTLLFAPQLMLAGAK